MPAVAGGGGGGGAKGARVLYSRVSALPEAQAELRFVSQRRGMEGALDAMGADGSRALETRVLTQFGLHLVSKLVMDEEGLELAEE